VSTPGPAPRPRSALALIGLGLARNLTAGARLALFLRVRKLDYHGAPGHFAALFAFNVAIWLAAAAVRAGFSGEFDPDAVLLDLAIVPLVLGAAYAVAALYGRREIAPVLAVALISADALLEAVGLALAMLPIEPAVVGLLGLVRLVWIWIIALRAVAVCAGTRRPQIYQGALVATALTAALFAFPSAEPWVEPEEPEAPPALAEEEFFHLQGRLIESTLASIAPGRPGVPELYFVGFAPDGSQEVFLDEMRYVKDLFDERYHTRDRSVVLVNGELALDEFPIASATNLRRVLKRVAEQMNPDEDALFLFMSAHGDEQHRLAAWQAPLELAAVTPTSLARMLQDAGIRWKMIVVSACYSGGFIEPLKDENTMIITASAADRPSFGCEPGQEFTYFGRAYFVDALEHTRSFIEAFAMARKALARQETREKLEASMPQIWVGRALERRLPAWEGLSEAAR